MSARSDTVSNAVLITRLADDQSFAMNASNARKFKSTTGADIESQKADIVAGHEGRGDQGILPLFELAFLEEKVIVLPAPLLKRFR
jgi:hypothetical protein